MVRSGPFANVFGSLLIVLFSVKDLLWPEGEESLSLNAVDCIDKILTVRYEIRPGTEGTKSPLAFLATFSAI